MDKAKIMNKPRDFKNLMSEKKILQNDSAFLVHLHWAFQNDTDFVLVMDFVGKSTFSNFVFTLPQ